MKKITQNIILILCIFNNTYSQNIILQSNSLLQNYLQTTKNQNGQLQKTFSDSLEVTLPGIIYIPYILGNGSDYLSNILYNEQKEQIIATGTSKFNGSYFSLASIFLNGSLNTYFGNNGSQYISNFGDANNSVCYTSLESNGYILGGTTEANGGIHFALAKFTEQGLLDTTFGDNNSGKTFIPGYIAENSFSEDVMYSITLAHRNNFIIAAGSTAKSVLGVPKKFFALTQYTPSGKLNPFFGGNNTGYTYLDKNISGGTSDTCYAVATQSNGDIILAGISKNILGENNIALASFDQNGIHNKKFCKDTGYSVIQSVTIANEITTAKPIAMLIQPDNKILVAGGAIIEAKVYCLIVRFNADGTLDQNFGEDQNGIIIIQQNINGGTFDTALSLALQKDNKIIVGGVSNNNAILIRLQTNGILDPTFAENGIQKEISGRYCTAVLTPVNKFIFGVHRLQVNDSYYFSIGMLSNIFTNSIFQSVFPDECGIIS